MERQVKKSGLSTKLLAVDTETTGLDLRHDCKPFLIATCTEEGDVRNWEWPVDPLTRQPIIPHRDKLELADYINRFNALVFHHAKFDLRALSEIGIGIYFRKDDFHVSPRISPGYGSVSIVAETYHDTLFASHACSTGDRHGLKDLAVKYLRYSDSDETELKELVKKATNYCRSHDIEVKFGKDPKGQRQTGADYWLPKFTAKFVMDEIVARQAELHSLSQEKHKPYRTIKRIEKLRHLINELELLYDGFKGCANTYAGKDVERTILLWQFFSQVMEDIGVRHSYERERVLMQTVYRMETGGISINQSKMKRKVASLAKRADSYAKPAAEFASKLLGKEANIESGDQIRTVLFDKAKGLGLESKSKTDAGKPSADKKALEDLLEDVSHPNSPRYNEEATNFLECLMLSRSYKKAIEACGTYTSYAQPHPKVTGKSSYSVLYPSLNQTGSEGDMATTRFSSSNPNGQNVSAIVEVKIGRKEFEGPRLRDLFAPIPGRIWYDIDYSQLELRIFAFCSGEKALIEALANGYDFHEYVACRIFGKPADQITKQERRIAKNTNFAIIFGASAWKVDLTAGMSGAYEMFANQFPSVMPFMEETIARVREDRCVYTLDNYRLDVPNHQPYKGVSYKIQGTAGSIIKNAMIQIDKKQLVDWKTSRLVLQVHDELILETKRDHASHKPKFVFDVMNEMEQAGADLGVYTPVSCNRIETDWGHGEPVIVTNRSIRPDKKAA